MKQLRVHFRPEFLNRVDDIVFFTPLSMEEIRQIVLLLVEDLRHRLEDRGIRFEMEDDAVDLAAREGYDPVYGARPLKRFLQHRLETQIGRALISGEVLPGAGILVGVRDGEFEVRITPPAAGSADN